MRSRTFADGTITIQMSGNGNPPDRQDGQHTNMSTLWARRDDGPWLRVSGVRSYSMAHRVLEQSDDAAEAIVSLCWEAMGMGNPRA